MSEGISVRELDAMRRASQPHTVLDVREAEELAICQLDGVLHVPMNEVPARVADLPRDQPVVVLCHHGVRSRMVVDYLRGAGFGNAINLDGGIDAWARQIDAGVTRY